MLNRKNYGHEAKKLLILKNAKTATFVSLDLKGYFFSISIYGLILVNWSSQIYLGQQNAKEITL